MDLTWTKWCDCIVYTFKGTHIERIYLYASFWSDILQKLEQYYFVQFMPCFKKAENSRLQQDALQPTMEMSWGVQLQLLSRLASAVQTQNTISEIGSCTY